MQDHLRNPLGAEAKEASPETHSFFQPVNYFRRKSEEQDAPSHQMEGNQHLAVKTTDTSSHTSK